MATVFLDTSPFIYLIEEHPEYLAVVEPMFRRIEEGKDRAVTSVVTLAEVLVKPLRLGRFDLAEQYREMLQTSSGVDVLPVSREVSVQAAELRARWNLSLPTPSKRQLQCKRAPISSCATILDFGA